MPYNPCTTKGCPCKNARFNFKGKSPGIKCAKHGKPLGMVNNYARLCAHETCGNTNPSFGLPGGAAGYCKIHKSADMVNLVSRKCPFIVDEKTGKKCGVVPSYNKPDCKSGIMCAEHGKLFGMVDVVHNKCNKFITKTKKCGKIAYFNIDGENKGIRCMEHKDPNMVNVLSAKCLKCNNRPYYSKDGKSPEYCKIHKKKGMKRLEYNMCKKCDTQASFNYPGKKAKYCIKHVKTKKGKTMVNVRKQECEFHTCGRQAKYNISTETSPRFCGKHANKKTMEDIISKQCLECKSQPIFNYHGEIGGIYCTRHKKDGMIPTVYVRCKYNGEIKCNNRAFYNFKKKGKVAYCRDHKKPNMVLFDRKLCKTDSCLAHARNKNYKGYCFECFIKKYPESEITISYRTKELAVVDHIKKWMVHDYMVFNKTITGGQSKRRPDIFIDVGTHIVIVEVDEYGHTRYNGDDEYNRILDIIEDIGSKPLSLIRFNPDSYKDKNKKISVPSPWVKKLNGTELDLKYKDEWESRLHTLLCCVEDNIDNMPKRSFKETHLFF